jgi:hypothetical protein
LDPWTQANYQKLIQVDLAEDGAQCGLGDLGCRLDVVLDGDDRPVRVDDVEVGDRVDPYGDVVPDDHVLPLRARSTSQPNTRTTDR